MGTTEIVQICESGIAGPNWIERFGLNPLALEEIANFSIKDQCWFPSKMINTRSDPRKLKSSLDCYVRIVTPIIVPSAGVQK